MLELSTKLKVGAVGQEVGRAGFIFDRYAPDDFKFVTIDAASNQVAIGHYTKKSGWVNDAVASKDIVGGTEYNLGISVKATTVSVTVNGQAIVGHAFNAVAVDGDFGLLATTGQASFDDVKIKTSDRAFAAAPGSNMLASDSMLVSESASTLTQAELDSAAVTAMTGWMELMGDADPRLAGFGDVQISVGDLAGDTLGYAEGRTVWIDRDAAGYGWSINGGTMDLATVVSHELGHVLGFKHEDEGVMQGSLQPGLSYLLEATGFDADPDKPISNAALMDLARKAVELKFDLDAGMSASNSAVDWHAVFGSSWSADYSPYLAARETKSAKANFSDYLVKLAAAADFDSLGKSLVGAKKKGR
jgi:hypothetical protein